MYLLMNIMMAQTEGKTPLHRAASQGHTYTVKKLIDRGGDVNVTDNEGWTPLHRAAQYGNTDTAKILIDGGADVNKANRDGWTPLSTAALRGHTDIVKQLIDRGADVNKANNEGMTPLYWAASDGRTDTVNALVDRGGDVNKPNNDGETALHWAALEGYTDTLVALIIRGGDVNYADSDGETPLHWAASMNEIDTVKVLVDRGAGVNTKTNKGWTPLHQTASRGHTDILKALIDGGARVNMKGHDGCTPLHQAAAKGHTDVVQALTERGGNVNKADNGGETPLHQAASMGHTDVVQALTDRGGNVNKADNRGCTPLHKAALFGQTDTVQQLIISGADVNSVDDYGLTALHVAAQDDYPDTVKALIDGGEGVNMVTTIGRTALHWAALEGQTDTLKALIGRGGDVNKVDSDGQTPLHWAAHEGYTDTVKLLVDTGADLNGISGTGNTPLIEAIEDENLDSIEVLLDGGADANIYSPCTHMLPLHYMCCLFISFLKDMDEISVYLWSAVISKTASVTTMTSGCYTVLDMLLLGKREDPQHELWANLLQTHPLYKFPFNKPLYVTVPKDIRNEMSLHTTASALVCQLSSSELHSLIELMPHESLRQFLNAKNILRQGICHILVMEYGKIHHGNGSSDIQMLENKLNILIKTGLECNSTDINKRTPLHLTYMSGNQTVIDLMKSLPSLPDCIGKVPEQYLKRQTNSQNIQHPNAQILQLLSQRIKDNGIHPDKLVYSLYNTPSYGRVYMDETNTVILETIRHLLNDIISEICKRDDRFYCLLKLAGSVAENTKTGEFDEIDFVIFMHALMEFVKVTLSFSNKCALIDPSDVKKIEEFCFMDCAGNAHFSARAYIDRFWELFVVTIQSINMFDYHPLTIEDCVRRNGFVVTLHVTWHGECGQYRPITVDLLPAIIHDDWMVLLQPRYFDNVEIGANLVRMLNTYELSSSLKERKLLFSLPEHAINGYRVAKMVLHIFNGITFNVNERQRTAHDIIQSYLLKTALFWLIGKQTKLQTKHKTDPPHYDQTYCMAAKHRQPASDNSNMEDEVIYCRPCWTVTEADSHGGYNTAGSADTNANYRHITHVCDQDGVDTSTIESIINTVCPKQTQAVLSEAGISWNDGELPLKKLYAEMPEVSGPTDISDKYEPPSQPSSTIELDNFSTSECTLKQTHPRILSNRATMISLAEAQAARLWALDIYKMLRHILAQKMFSKARGFIYNYFLKDKIVHTRDCDLVIHLCDTVITLLEG